MENSGLLPSYVARCPIQLFEAPPGSGSWLPTGAAEEFHLRPLGNAVLLFQLWNVLDNQILFEHTLHKPDYFIVLSHRFFVIRLENGDFRGFGFSDLVAAHEMKEHVHKAFNLHNVEEHVGNNLTEERGSSIPSLELVTFSGALKSSNWKLSWKRLTSFPYLRNWNAITEAFGWQEHEMEIGLPTDVKHVAHIGWDGPSVCGPSWVEELKASPNYATGPLKEFGQPMGSDWIHDALSAAKWTSPGHGDEGGPPPAPPAEFLDSEKAESQKKHGRWNVLWLLRKSRDQKRQAGRA